MSKQALIATAALVALTIASAPSTHARKTKPRPREGGALELKLAAKLESCTPFRLKFEHPLTGDTLLMGISGNVEGKCLYIEQMPRGGQLECRYDRETRKAVARFYRFGTHAARVFGPTTA